MLAICRPIVSSPPIITVSKLLKSCATPPVKLTDGFELLRLAQRCFGLISARNFFRYTLFKRGIELLKSQGRSGYIFTRAIESLSEVRCVMSPPR